MIMNILNEFGNMAGLRVNQMKSSIYMAKIVVQLKQAISIFRGSLVGIFHLDIGHSVGFF